MCTHSSGTIPASSQASNELSTASFTAVSKALRGLSNPSKWRFFAKNSLTEISRCFAAMDSAVTRWRDCPSELIALIVSYFSSIFSRFGDANRGADHTQAAQSIYKGQRMQNRDLQNAIRSKP